MTSSARRPRGRPPVSSREALEEVAFDLLLRDGYEATTVQAIMEAGKVGRTTFFRYFGSKGGIVWGEFDRAIERLRGCLEATDDVPVMAAVVDAVLESTRLSRDAAPDTWLDRFRVLDEDAALRGDTAEHWRLWAAVVARYVESRTDLTSGSVVSAAVGGAVQAAYVAVLRRWAATDDETEIRLALLETELRPLRDALQPLLDTAS